MKMKKGFLMSVLCCVPLTGQAYEYFIDPVFQSNERYNSNIYMRQKPMQGNWISTLSPGVNFGLRHENGELKSNFTWNQIFYTNQTELNVAEQLFNVDYKHKYQRFEWSLGGSYNNQSSITTETTTNGLQSVQLMRKLLSVAPSVTYSLNELSSVSLDYSYNNTKYEKNSNNVFYSDYDYHQASGTFNHLYTERDKLNATLSSSLYKTKTQTTNNNVAQLGWQHSFSEQLITYVSAGINYAQVESQSTVPLLSQYVFRGFPVYYDSNGIPTFQSGGNPAYYDPTIISSTNPFGLTPQQQFATVTSSKTTFGQVYRASIQKSFEKGSVSLVGSQNQSPTSLGLQTQTQLTFNTAYTINERWTSGLAASYTKSDITGQTNSPYNRTNYSISPNINWKCTPEINLGLSYTYRQQEYQSNAITSLGNIVQLQFSYQPQINHQVK
jgi:hypothetical protein